MCQQDVARGERGEGFDLVGVEWLVAEHAAFDHQQLVGLGELPERFGDSGDIAVRTVGLFSDECERGRSDEQVLDLQAGVSRSEPYQRVLVDLVLAACFAECPAQLGHGRDVKSPILGEDRSVGVSELLFEFVDDCDFLRSRVFHFGPRVVRILVTRHWVKAHWVKALWALTESVNAQTNLENRG